MSTSYYSTAPLVDGMLRTGATPAAVARYRLSGLGPDPERSITNAGKASARGRGLSERARFLAATLAASPFLALRVWSVIS
jgi:hypothetical protein